MFFKAAWLDFLSPAGELVLITSLLLSHLFSNEKQARGFFYWLANCLVVLFTSEALPPFSSNKKRPRESHYWRAEFRSSAPGGSGPNGNRVALVFFSFSWVP